MNGNGVVRLETQAHFLWITHELRGEKMEDLAVSSIIRLPKWVERWKMTMKDGFLQLRKELQRTPQNKNIFYLPLPITTSADQGTSCREVPSGGKL